MCPPKKNGVKDILLPQFWTNGTVEHKKLNSFVKKVETKISPTLVHHGLSLYDTFAEFDGKPRVIATSEQSCLFRINSINLSAFIENFHGKQEWNNKYAAYLRRIYFTRTIFYRPLFTSQLVLFYTMF